MEQFIHRGETQSLKTALLRQLNLTGQNASALIRQGQVKVNGKRIRENILLKTEDEVSIYLPVHLQSLMPPILFEGSRLLVIEKQPGVAVCDAPGLTLTELLHRNGFPQARAVHRLDVYTGGVIAFALDEQAEADLTDLIKERLLQKQYECIVSGLPSPTFAYKTAYLSKD